MSEIKEVWDMLWDVYDKAKGTPWENVVPVVVIGAVFFLLFKLVVVPLAKGIFNLYNYISKKWFVKKNVYEKLSFMESSDLYYAIKNYIPTRYSRVDPSNNEEPVPEYLTCEGEKEPLLLQHFLKYEYSVKNGGKYYLCLGDCGMGKTTFLINLYYQTLKLHKYKCVFISLQEENCIEQIEAVEDQPKTILLLDALDENENALTDYEKFSTLLERVTHNFYRVIITARTNFFENETKEQISNNKSNISMLDKISSSRKYYIAPFTDEDIKKFLRKRYHYNLKKFKRAWKIVEKNKNLSVRPLLLRFMDELLEEEYSFEYDFQLYEYLFDKWIERERRNINEELGKNLYEEWDEGLVVVAAAGNQGPKPGSVTAPGCSKKIITVGSSDMLSGKQAVSGRGPTFECVCKPDLVAPGRQIMACTPGAGNLYSMKSGTSMSTPLVSGAIALALEKDPLLSNVEIKMMLRDSCDDMGLPRNQQGWGKFNCKKFLAL